jgi:hypothetical protein
VFSTCLLLVCFLFLVGAGSPFFPTPVRQSVWNEDAVVCPQIFITNGAVVYPSGSDPAYASQVANFFCNNGFGLQGVRTATCLPDFTWSAPAPVCVQVISNVAPTCGSITPTFSPTQHSYQMLLPGYQPSCNFTVAPANGAIIAASYGWTYDPTAQIWNSTSGLSFAFNMNVGQYVVAIQVISVSATETNQSYIFDVRTPYDISLISFNTQQVNVGWSAVDTTNTPIINAAGFDRLVLMPSQAATSAGFLKSFTVYAKSQSSSVNAAPFYMQIWRLSSGSTYTLVYQQYCVPNAPSGAFTFPVTQTLNINVGDFMGWYAPTFVTLPSDGSQVVGGSITYSTATSSVWYFESVSGLASRTTASLTGSPTFTNRAYSVLMTISQSIISPPFNPFNQTYTISTLAYTNQAIVSLAYTSLAAKISVSTGLTYDPAKELWSTALAGGLLTATFTWPSLVQGANSITILVTAPHPDAKQVYTFTLNNLYAISGITYTCSGSPPLSQITPSAFAPAQPTYTLTLLEYYPSCVFTVAQSNLAIVTAKSGSQTLWTSASGNSFPISLSPGNTLLTISVTTPLDTNEIYSWTIVNQPFCSFTAPSGGDIGKQYENLG